MGVLSNRLQEIAGVVKRDLTDLNIFNYMNEILQMVNLDEELRPEIDALDGDIMVFEATDTGRSISISFSSGSVNGEIGKKEDSSLKFEATERTYLELLIGKLDPDSAFFRRKIKITGPIVEAVKFKNIFFAKFLGKR